MTLGVPSYPPHCFSQTHNRARITSASRKNSPKQACHYLACPEDAGCLQRFTHIRTKYLPVRVGHGNPVFGRLTHKFIWHVQLSTSCKGFHFSRCIRLTWGQQRDVDYEGKEQESVYSQLLTKTIRHKSHDSSHESCQTLSHRQCRSSKALRERERQPTVNWMEESVVTAMDRERNSY